MENKLQQLTQKLYDEGLEKGRAEADKLVADAKAEARKIVAKEVAFGNGQIRKGGNTLTIEAVAPAPGFSECFFGLDKLVLHLQ